jgi:hypothetical protein
MYFSSNRFARMCEYFAEIIGELAYLSLGYNKCWLVCISDYIASMRKVKNKGCEKKERKGGGGGDMRDLFLQSKNIYTRKNL